MMHILDRYRPYEIFDFILFYYFIHVLYGFTGG